MLPDKPVVPTAPVPEPDALAKLDAARLLPPPPAAGASASVAAKADTGTVVFRVAPWGRVLVDRYVVGTTPPLKQLSLSEGEHRIEITNPAAQSVVKFVQVKKGETVVVSHKFE